MKFSVQGAGPLVLLVHGLPTSGRLWDYVVPILEPKFTCVVVDLPGLGESRPLADGSLDPDRYAQVLEALGEQLSIPSWHIIAHDAGSVIAVHYAAQFGERLDRLVLCSPPIFPEHRIPLFIRLIRTPIVGDFLAPFVTMFLWRVGFYLAIKRRDRPTTEIIEAFRRPFTGYSGTRRFAHLARWGDPAQVLGKTAALLPSISAPTLILHGRKDGAIPISFATRAAAIIPDTEIHLLDCGHFLPLNCPDALCGHLLPFLEKEHSTLD